ncbi:hypothetical protein DL95DRAFT_169600 [Leptodontidium sp. 2 PMI_412]|nr:hypothetical protein DL95DRAFT_169600 [Leptodontidium sp. 2 PMI_412]
MEMQEQTECERYDDCLTQLAAEKSVLMTDHRARTNDRITSPHIRASKVVRIVQMDRQGRVLHDQADYVEKRKRARVPVSQEKVVIVVCVLAVFPLGGTHVVTIPFGVSKYHVSPHHEAEEPVGVGFWADGPEEKEMSGKRRRVQTLC